MSVEGELAERVGIEQRAQYHGHRGWLYAVAVHADLRRRGIGRALVQTVEDSLVVLGCPKPNLQVVASNAAVVGFYERLGFCVEERISMGRELPLATTTARSETTP